MAVQRLGAVQKVCQAFPGRFLASLDNFGFGRQFPITQSWKGKSRNIWWSIEPGDLWQGHGLFFLEPCFRVRGEDSERSPISSQHLIRLKDRDILITEDSDFPFFGINLELLLNFRTVRVRPAIEKDRLRVSLVN